MQTQAEPQTPAAAEKPAANPGPDAPMLPVMSSDELALFERSLRGVGRYLEFGAGGSTALAARCGVARIVSVESDRAWLDRLALLPEMAGVDFLPLAVDIGPTGGWGMPTHPAQAPKWPAYHQSVWSQLAWTPDLVLVDGRFRIACTLACVLHCPPGTALMIHDFWNRPDYHVVLDHLETVERTGTLGLFRTRPITDVPAFVAKLMAHALDPR